MAYILREEDLPLGRVKGSSTNKYNTILHLVMRQTISPVCSANKEKFADEHPTLFVELGHRTDGVNIKVHGR